MIADRFLPDGVLEALSAAAPGVTFEEAKRHSEPTQDVALVARSEYRDLVVAAKDGGFNFFADLCGVDYLSRKPRFEVVVVLLSHDLRRRIRIRVGVPMVDPTLDTISDLYAGANFYEREVFDMFGIGFKGHPDLTRILMPDDWEGHPLRKDYAVGSVPVQFKESHKAP